MAKMGLFHIGTSGWHYNHWKGPFYPKQMPSKEFLSFYLQYFTTVEINRTFYSVPEKKVFENYRKMTSSSFTFAVKGSRFITHIKRLKEPKASLQFFFDRVKELKSRLGPVLFLIPP